MTDYSVHNAGITADGGTGCPPARPAVAAKP